MSYEAARVAIATHVQSSWASAGNPATLEFENIHEIDHGTRNSPFVTYQLAFYNATQVTIENVPITRYEGEVIFHVHVPCGSGAKPAYDLADVISGFMKYRDLSGIQFLAARLMAPQEFKGWQIWPVRISFHYRE